MRSRASRSSDHRLRIIAMIAAALILLLAGLAAAFYTGRGRRTLILQNPDDGREYARYAVRVGEEFGVGFIHSVNKSPVTDFYEIREDGIYVVRTVYYGFGAGVQTQLEEGQTLTYGEDGSMIVSGFDQKMDNLTYIVGTVSDHTLTLDGQEISLRELCGKNALVQFVVR